MDFSSIIISLENLGLTDVLLPFILIFAIVFAVLQNINLFGKEKKNINVIIALVLALTVVIPHVTGNYPPGGDVVEIMNKALPSISLILIAVIMLLLLVGVWGIRYTGGSIKGLIAIISIGLVVYIFGASAGWWSGGFGNIITANPETTAVVVALLVFGIIIWVVTAEPRKPGEQSMLGSLMKNLNESFEKER